MNVHSRGEDGTAPKLGEGTDPKVVRGINPNLGRSRSGSLRVDGGQRLERLQTWI